MLVLQVHLCTLYHSEHLLFEMFSLSSALSKNESFAVNWFRSYEIFPLLSKKKIVLGGDVEGFDIMALTNQNFLGLFSFFLSVFFAQ